VGLPIPSGVEVDQVQRVLVTGATGFVGGRVARRLRSLGHEVAALVRSPTEELDELGIQQHVVALQDLEGIQRVGADADAIVHAAATADPETAQEVNVGGSRAVAGAALLSGLRLVHVSTTSVYDLEAAPTLVVDERHPLVARDGAASPVSSSGSAYATTKAHAEREVVRAVRNGLAGAILRPPAVLGAGPTSTWGTRVPRRIRDGAGPAIAGESTFGWVHVEDLVDTVVATLDTDTEVIRGLTANVVGGHVPFSTYRGEVARFLGDVPPPPPDPDRVWRGRYSTAQLVQTLDVRPSRTFEDAVSEIRASWRDGEPDA
jgi:2-alkyl-3-oxoalkanoate reductase